MEYGSTPGNKVSLPPAAAAANTAIAAQAVTRSNDSTARTTNPAVDIAFQAYASPLLLVANVPPSEIAAVSGNADKATPSQEASGDFIQLGDSFDAHGDATAEAIAEERAAIDAVLGRLQEVESLPVAALANAITEEQLIDAATALPFDSIALAETEGGMVMLDAHEATIAGPADMAMLAENAVELPRMSAGVDSAVGFYQAIDVGGEELSTAETAAVARPTIDPLNRTRSEERLSNDGGQRSQKAAMAITASTLAGALLWAAQRKRSDDEGEELAVK